MDQRAGMGVGNCGAAKRAGHPGSSCLFLSGSADICDP